MTEIIGDVVMPIELIIPTETTATVMSGALVVSGGQLMFLHGADSIHISGAAISV